MYSNAATKTISGVKAFDVPCAVDALLTDDEAMMKVLANLEISK
jgi:hypothetical protein